MRNTDKLIDETKADKVSDRYDRIFSDWGYICTWDFLDFQENDYRVGMCCYTTDRDSLESVEKAIKSVAADLGLDDPVSINVSDDDENQKNWLQPINLVLPDDAVSDVLENLSDFIFQE